MDFSREKLIEIWQRAAPGTPPPDLFDTLAYPDGEAHGAHDPSHSAGPPESPAPQPSPDGQDAREVCGALRRAADAELALYALYRALSAEALRRHRRADAREFIRMANDAYAAARRTAGAYYLASGEYRFDDPPPPEYESLRDGIRRAWTLERMLARLYAHLEPDVGGEAMTRLHSAHSLALRELLEANL